MPTYAYECRKCGHQFERFQSIMAEPVKTCPKPKCRGKVARMLTTGGGLIFKGSGFYQTDYKKTSAPAMEKTESKKPESGKTDSGKTNSGNKESAKAETPAK